MNQCFMNLHENWDAVFRNSPELEVLVFLYNSFDRKNVGKYDFLVQIFPKLKQLILDTVAGFLHLNPQLKKLASKRTTDEIMDAIAKYVKDIEELRLMPNLLWKGN